jgi:hypothetical protein
MAEQTEEPKHIEVEENSSTESESGTKQEERFEESMKEVRLTQIKVCE